MSGAFPFFVWVAVEVQKVTLPFYFVSGSIRLPGVNRNGISMKRFDCRNVREWIVS